jgi:dolichyl-diphosphooligosaccharide--protein glycosyltransferase
MGTSAIIYWTLHKLSIPVDIRNVCVFLAPVFAAFTAIAAYLMTNVIIHYYIKITLNIDNYKKK